MDIVYTVIRESRIPKDNLLELLRATSDRQLAMQHMFDNASGSVALEDGHKENIVVYVLEHSISFPRGNQIAFIEVEIVRGEEKKDEGTGEGDYAP
ncbi:hypothetical protein LCGC14_0245720 [marine sediment metagenome]|uniref:Uncharacterized protein n=1 Tax=marine sediment metagenome TaxID=412755 RepID=A0A0F9WR21_9ZZZZ